jgi:hypothetical protein
LSREFGWNFDEIGAMSEREISFSIEMAQKAKGITAVKKEELPEDDDDITKAFKEVTDRKKEERIR